MKRSWPVISFKLIEGEGIFVCADGVRIAKRGEPGTPQAGTWIAVEPGWTVHDNEDLTEIVVRFQGVTVH